MFSLSHFLLPMFSSRVLGLEFWCSPILGLTLIAIRNFVFFHNKLLCSITWHFQMHKQFWPLDCIAKIFQLQWFGIANLGGGPLIGNLNDMSGWVCNKTPCIRESFKEIQIIILLTRGYNMDTFLYQCFQFNVINVSTTYTKHK